MNIRHDIILKLEKAKWAWHFPLEQIRQFLIGLFHGFPVCCIAQFIYTWLFESFSNPYWVVYDLDRGLQYCRFHSLKIRRQGTEGQYYNITNHKLIPIPPVPS